MHLQESKEPMANNANRSMRTNGEQSPAGKRKHPTNNNPIQEGRGRARARHEGDGEAYRRGRGMRTKGEEGRGRARATLFRPLSRRWKTGSPAVLLPSCRPTNANAEPNRLQGNGLCPDWRKWPKNGRPARTPHRTRPILLGSPRRLLHNPKTLNELRRARFGFGWLDCPIWHKSGLGLAWACVIDEE